MERDVCSKTFHVAHDPRLAEEVKYDSGTEAEVADSFKD